MSTVASAALGDRSAFPDLDVEVYLAHAAIAPPPRAVQQAAAATLHAFSARGAGAAVEAYEQRQRLRGKLAGLLNAGAESVGLTPSTTWGILAIARSLRLYAGERLVLFEGEFPANVAPWLRLAEDLGLEVRWVKAESFSRDIAVGLAELEHALAGGVRLCAVSFVQFRDGLRMPLADIAERVHAAGGELFVDAIQGIGAVPLDVTAAGIDYLACGAHKWLLSLEGAGFVYVREDLLPSLSGSLSGWLSQVEPIDFLVEDGRTLRYDKPLQPDAGRFEVGSSANIAYAALEAGVDLISGLGVSAIYTHLQRYHDLLEAPLEDLGLRSLRAPGAAQRSGSLSFEMPEGQSVSVLARALREAGIVCSTPDGALRMAPHFANSLEEVPRVVAAVERALDGRGLLAMEGR